MKMISIRKKQREEVKKSRASSTAQSLPTIDENVDKKNNIRLSERPSSDSLSSFFSMGSSEGIFDISNISMLPLNLYLQIKWYSNQYICGVSWIVGDMSLEIEEVMKLMQEIGSLDDSDMHKAQEETNVFRKDDISNKNISQTLFTPTTQNEKSSPTNQV